MNSNTYHIFFSNLANPLRIGIITELKNSPLSVNDICEKLNVEQSKISHALKSLRCCRLVEANQKGKQRIYSLNKKTIAPILDIIDKHAKTFCKGKCVCSSKGSCKDAE
jgi:ArsR family transcriptional regulator, arsenate/arsenite/antimonite-responsive transcriptional repressor